MKRIMVALAVVAALLLGTPPAGARPPGSTAESSSVDVVTVSGSVSRKSPTWQYGVMCYAGAVSAELRWSPGRSAPTVTFSAYRTQALSQAKDDPRSKSGSASPLVLTWPSTSPAGIYMFTVSATNPMSFTLIVTCDRTK